MELVGGLQSFLCDSSFDSIYPKVVMIVDRKIFLKLFSHIQCSITHESNVFNFHTTNFIMVLNLNVNKNFPFFSTFRYTKRK